MIDKTWLIIGGLGVISIAGLALGYNLNSDSNPTPYPALSPDPGLNAYSSSYPSSSGNSYSGSYPDYGEREDPRQQMQPYGGGKRSKRSKKYKKKSKKNRRKLN
jgi:hypothetical protein